MEIGFSRFNPSQVQVSIPNIIEYNSEYLEKSRAQLDGIKNSIAEIKKPITAYCVLWRYIRADRSTFCLELLNERVEIRTLKALQKSTMLNSRLSPAVWSRPQRRWRRLLLRPPTPPVVPL